MASSSVSVPDIRTEAGRMLAKNYLIEFTEEELDEMFDTVGVPKPADLEAKRERMVDTISALNETHHASIPVQPTVSACSACHWGVPAGSSHCDRCGIEMPETYSLPVVTVPSPVKRARSPEPPKLDTPDAPAEQRHSFNAKAAREKRILRRRDANAASTPTPTKAATPKQPLAAAPKQLKMTVCAVCKWGLSSDATSCERCELAKQTPAESPCKRPRAEPPADTTLATTFGFVGALAAAGFLVSSFWSSRR